MKEFTAQPKLIDGSDLGFLWFDKEANKINDSYKIKAEETIEKLNVKSGEEICLVGYPQNKKGALQKLNGTIKELAQLVNG